MAKTDPPLEEDELAEIKQSNKILQKLTKKTAQYQKDLVGQIEYSKQIYSTNPQTLIRKKSLASATTLIKKVKKTLENIVGLRADIEMVLAEVDPQEFVEPKFNEWESYQFEITDSLARFKDEAQSLISSTTAYLKEDRSESQ